MLVSSSAAIWIFIAILVISAFIAYSMPNYEYFDKTRFHSFIVILTGLGIVIVFMFYYNVVSLQSQQQDLAELDEIAHVNDVVLNGILTSLIEASASVPSFVSSLTPLTNTACCSGTGCNYIPESDPINVQNCTIKATLSYRIFNSWQTVILENGFLHNDALGYVSNFLQKANSGQLYEQWKVSRLNFIPDCQQFGDLLFLYGLPITNQIPESYIQAAEQLIADPRYAAIFNT